MSANSHTPGPWAIHPRLKTALVIVPADHADRPIGGSSMPADDMARYAMQIATVHKDWHGRSDLESNARLIAAAPDLLAALQALADSLPSPEYMRQQGKEEGPLLQQMRAAIAKATGGQP